jgi:hypothetical protein
MGTPYASQSATGYSSSPPADDGSAVAANKVKYATIKTQLGDPVKTLADAINTALRASLNVTATAQSTAYTTTVADHLRPIEVTGTTTISLGDAATMVASAMGYSVPIINRGVATVTVGRITGTDTLDGATKNITLAPGQGVIAAVNSTNNGYNVIAVANGVIFDATDPSKQVKFDVSGITTGTTRTLTAPNANFGWASAGLTSGRIALSGASGLLTDSASFTYVDSGTQKAWFTQADASSIAQFYVENTNASSGDANVTVKSGAGSGGAYFVATANGTGDAGIDLTAGTHWVLGVDNSVSDQFVIGTTQIGTSDKIQITTAGAVTLVATGTHTINGPLAISGASAGQIVFPASQNASANANTLDDYEEGTWTISFTFATVGDLAVSAETKEAYYVKTGKQVFTYWNYTFTPTFTTSAGNAQLTGLPFTSQNNTNPQCIARGTVRHNVRVTYGAGNTNIHPAVTNNATTMLLITQGTGAVTTGITTANFTSAQSTDVHGTITYEASA